VWVNGAIRQSVKVNTVQLALGANMHGRWGEPHATLLRACRELEAQGLEIVQRSCFYVTTPVGGGRQPRYLNTVLTVRTGQAPGALLRLVKSLERRAGRKLAPRMTARPLDIDIIDYGGRRMGRPGGHRRHGQLILPHPEMHRRAFVLRPLQDVAPHWQHPVLRRPVKALLAHLNPADRAGVTLDSASNSCKKGLS
jgi:2-amino-4-hydroxy-6-hydroxymethyldihydropteridine diphosphokinase